MASAGPRRFLPSVVGLSSIVLIFVVVEILIRVGLINRFIVPLPSDVAKSFGRVIVEEDIFHRFLLTGWECLAAGVLLTVFGVAIGVLLHQVPLMRRCGFDSFAPEAEIDAATLEASLSRYAYVYQAAADSAVPVWKLRHG